jgi:hypothetical protein
MLPNFIIEQIRRREEEKRRREQPRVYIDVPLPPQDCPTAPSKKQDDAGERGVTVVIPGREKN